MSLKTTEDKDKPGFPWTARQKRKLLHKSRLSRKQARAAKKFIARLRQAKKAPKRKAK